MGWYDDIEDEVIAREEWAEYSATINQFDEYIRKLELEALRYTEKNGFQPSIMRKHVYDCYFTETGEKKVVKTEVNQQNIKWINSYIQKRLLARSIRFSPLEIRQALHDVSQAYMAAEMRRVPLTVQLSETLRHRLEKAG